jgi:4-amino-4-deoxy-L-arabinose transferase-like glycosyltransferase
MPEFTTNQTEPGGSFATWRVAAIAASVVFVYMFGLTIPLVGPDEPRYAQVAREMFESGNWITPTLGGYTWFEKPALLYWLQTAAYQLFGVTEFAARLGPALCGLATIASLAWLARHADLPVGPPEVPDLDRSRRSFSLHVALIAASALGTVVFSRAASFDIIVTFPITAALAAFFIFDRTDSRLAIASFYFFIGVALLAKGLIGVLFPLGVVAAFYLFSIELPSRKFLSSLLWGLPLAMVVAAVWYVPAYLNHGWAFVDEFFIQHHFQRFTSNKYQHPQPFYFFLWVLPLMIFPWTPFLFAEFGRRALRRIRGTLEASDAPRFFRFAAAWLIVPLAFFSLSGSKLPGYILPAVPPAILIAALFLNRRSVLSRAWRYGIFTGSAAMLGLIVILLLTAVPKFAASDSVKNLMAAADSRGLGPSRVMMFYTRSHNAEFYAAGRLLRDEAGKQRTFYRVDDLVPFVSAEPNASTLVLVPIEHVRNLQNSEKIVVDVIADNSELAIVSVTLRDAHPADARRNLSMSAAPIPISGTAWQ